MESKFKIGDEIFFMDYSTPKKEIVKGISFTIGQFGSRPNISTTKEPLIQYSVNEFSVVEESKAFSSKEELQNELFSKI